MTPPSQSTPAEPPKNSGPWNSVIRNPTLVVPLAALLVAVIIIVVTAQALRGQSNDVVVGLGAAIASAVVTLVLAVLSSFERQQEGRARVDAGVREQLERTSLRNEQRAFAALEYFTGRTQRRNVGISIIEGSWREVRDMRSIFIPLLVNQVSYLLGKSKEEDAAHEVDNCRRMVGLLVMWGDDYLGKSEMVYYDELRNVIDMRVDRADTKPISHATGGIFVEMQELRDWRRALA